MRIVVTTGRERSLAHHLEAQQIADRLELPFASRVDQKLESLAAHTGAEVIAVFGAAGLWLWRAGVKLRFSAGLAELRILRVQAGQREPLVELGALKASDSVLDCTLGLARDALVMAASGASVQAIESVPILAAFCETGLRYIAGAAKTCAPRVAIATEDHRSFLASTRRRFDVVYFDPMFTESVTMPPEYQLFRALANPGPLTRESLELARRVARRAVIIKDGPRGNVLKGLGLPLRALTFGNRVRYGSIDPV